jgi:hypothetical protein
MNTLIGKRFGTLTAISAVPRSKTSRAKILCRCDCGQEKAIDPASLVHGRTTSCGCERRSAISRATTKHGMSRTKEHMVWRSMKQRCTDINASNYAQYGGRGISVCDEWMNSFEAFIADMGMMPTHNSSIERENVNGNYEPANCRWATPVEQANNQRRNRTLTYLGRTQTIAQWARELNIPADRIYGRKRLGFSDAEALFIGNLNTRERSGGRNRPTNSE